MRNVTTRTTQSGQSTAALESFNRSLGSLSEEFHRTGRFDDGNAKLDEITKLLFVKIEEERRALRGERNRFSLSYLEEIAEAEHGDSGNIAQPLRDLFSSVADQPMYRNPDGSSIFGANPSLNIQPADNSFAQRVVQSMNGIELLDLSNAKATAQLDERFDVLNEAFGHFVRDSFRHTKEDAQYMTPSEVVSAMTDLAFSEIRQDEEAMKGLTDPRGSFIIADPTCGVGTFLVEGLHKALQVIDSSSPPPDVRERLRNKMLRDGLFGQDKVDRMVRLARLNLVLAGADSSAVVQGNSILGSSRLDQVSGKIDLILTNPPFGAEFPAEELVERQARDYPMLSDLYGKTNSSRTIVSEMALLDRCVSLLRPGGRLLIVLPDNISSGRGLHASVRDWIREHAIVRAVIGLPTTTFAQAGTRTKTIVLYIQKPDPLRHLPNLYIFMGVCRAVGYEVVERSGTPIKRSSGKNELPAIVESYRDSQGNGQAGPFTIVSDDPPAVWLRDDQIINGRWSPGFYQPRRLLAIKSLETAYSEDFALLRLGDLAEFIGRKRRGIGDLDTTKVISVKHCNEDGTINWGEVEGYSPKWPGIECRPGEVIFSKINPRIKRVCVIPDRPYQVTCSNEFEILKPGERIGPFMLAAMLSSSLVHDQVVSLSTGTSASHMRIKDVELREILVPVPRKGTQGDTQFTELEKALQEAVTLRYAADDKIRATHAMVNGHFHSADAPEHSERAI